MVRHRLTANKEAGLRSRASVADSVTHAGGIVFRRNDAAVTYLLVTARNSQEWVLPKGHVERGEQPEQTALREVAEEAGVVARLCARIRHDFSFVSKGEKMTVAFFLMEMMREGLTAEHRGKEWLTLQRALERATHEETRAALQLGDDLRRQLEAT